jgi:hypothetical protein
MKVTNLDFNHYCLTDRPDKVNGWAVPLQPEVPTHGWWNKINLFSPSMPAGWNLYLDIDIVILRDFDEEVLWAIKNTNSIACVSDAIHWMGERFNSSLMIYETGSQKHLFEKFSKEYESLRNRDGGDQVWAGPQLSDVTYLDEVFPNLKKNLKFDIAVSSADQRISLPKSISPEIKMIDCSGRPKPHELSMVPYIRQNWHEIS